MKKGLYITIALIIITLALVSCSSSGIRLKDENGKSYKLKSSDNPEYVAKVLTSIKNFDDVQINKFMFESYNKIDVNTKEIDNNQALKGEDLLDARFDFDGRTYRYMDLDNVKKYDSIESNLNITSLNAYLNVNAFSNIEDNKGVIESKEEAEIIKTNDESSGFYLNFGDLYTESNIEGIDNLPILKLFQNSKYYIPTSDFILLLNNTDFVKFLSNIINYDLDFGDSNFEIVLNNYLYKIQRGIQNFDIRYILRNKDALELANNYNITIKSVKKNVINFSACVDDTQIKEIFNNSYDGINKYNISFGINIKLGYISYISFLDKNIETNYNQKDYKYNFLEETIRLTYNDLVTIPNPSGKYEPLSIIKFIIK